MHYTGGSMATYRLERRYSRLSFSCYTFISFFCLYPSHGHAHEL